jgi:hypothetical protein
VLLMNAISLGPSPARGDVLARRICLLVAATITYNVVEAAVAITAGTLASSTALIGFGLDSVIEVSSAAAVARQFSARDHNAREAREKTTLRIIAVSFFALAAYVGVDAVRALAGTGEAERSVPGIVIAAALLLMPFLSAAQRKAGRELGRRCISDRTVPKPAAQPVGKSATWSVRRASPSPASRAWLSGVTQPRGGVAGVTAGWPRSARDSPARRNWVPR